MSKETLSHINKSQKMKEGALSFGATDYKMLKEIEIPCIVKNKKFNVKVAVIEGSIPLLLGRRTMIKMKMVHNVYNNCVDILDLGLRNIRTMENESNHACLSLGKLKEYCWLENYKENWINDSNDKRRNILLKLHLQFAHCGAAKLIKLLRNAYEKKIEKEKMREIEEEVKEITEKCNICKKYKRTPPESSSGHEYSSKI
jgi:hypothetical protein